MKYIIIAVVVIILVFTFKNWWENNWRSYYGEGIRRFRAKDYHGASEQLFKANMKKRDKWETCYYCGLANKKLSDNMNSREAIKVKEYAIICFIDALVLKPKNLKPNNMIEMMLCDERDLGVLKELIEKTKKVLNGTPEEVRFQFKYLAKIEKELVYRKKLKYSDAQKMGIRGKIKSLEEVVYFALNEDGMIVAGNYEEGRSYTFDNKGNVIEGKETAGSAVWHIKDNYDFNGNRVNEDEETLIYDETGNLIEREYKQNPYYFKTISSFNSNDFKTKEVRLNSKKEVAWIWIFKYDDKNKLLEKVNESKDKIGFHKITYRYDNYGRKDVSNFYDFENKFIGKLKYLYDNRGNSLNGHSEDFHNNAIIFKRELNYFDYALVYYP